MQNLFNSIQLKRPKTNVFDLTHDVKLSCNMGELIPTALIECIPGDKFNISCESLLRMAPLVSPMMHRCNVYMHYFFVPNRILWPNWEAFITNDPDDEGPFTTPFINVLNGGSNYTRLMDYMGIPDPGLNPGGSPTDEKISAIPFAAYNKIWDEYYRDQNLASKKFVPLVDGDNTGLFAIDVQKRAWEHDYFTAALPFAQKGDAVTLPLGTFNDVQVNANKASSPAFDDITASPDHDFVFRETTANTDIPTNNLYAKTSDLVATEATINDLRRAFRLQEWLEKAARGGSRYVENILVFFGVKSEDSRLQRPEYITGTVSPIVISEVLNTTGTDDLPQGNMAGHGVAVTSGKYGYYNVKEHGYIIGIMSVLPKTAYYQGINRTWLRTDPMDYFWPQFANIGEQPVRYKELYAFDAAFTGDQDVFGYVPRYAEYKYMASRVAGAFKTTLDSWHMARKFTVVPILTQDFVEADPTNRIFAVTDPGTEHLYVHILHKIRAVRCMPKFGTPSF